MNRLTGWSYIRNKLIQDFAALNKMEMLPWDCWGMMLNDPSDDFINDIKKMELLDYIAGLTVKPDKNVEQINQIYLAEKDLRVGDIVYCDSLTGNGSFFSFSHKCHPGI